MPAPNFDERITELETKIESAGKHSVSSILKAGWTVIVAFVAITVYLITNIQNKAPASTVYRHSETLSQHSLKIEQNEQKVDWLVKATYQIAQKMGIDLDPPP